MKRQSSTGKSCPCPLLPTIALLFLFIPADVAATPLHAAAGYVNGESIGRKPTDEGPPGATFDLCAYSEQNGKKNQATKLFDSRMPPVIKDLEACSNDITVEKKVFSPAVGVENQAKPKSEGRNEVSSETGEYLGLANVKLEPKSETDNTLQARLEAMASGGKEGEGRAAGKAVDPFMLDPGVYQYDPIIDVLLESDGPGDFAGVEFFAIDSRFSDPLWFLQIAVVGPILGKNDLQILFSSNEILGLNDIDITNMLLDSFQVIVGRAEISSYHLFGSAGMSYLVDQKILFGEGVEAGIIATNEPATILIFGFGLLGIAVLAWRRC